MKLLPLLILTIALSVGVACSSEPPPEPTPVPTPDVPTYSEDEVIGLVQGMLRAHPDEECRKYLNTHWYGFRAKYYAVEGEWRVVVHHSGREHAASGIWIVYEGSNAIRASSANHRCYPSGSNAVERGEGTYQKVFSDEHETKAFNCRPRGR